MAEEHEFRLPGMIGSTRKWLCEYFVVIEHKGVVHWWALLGVGYSDKGEPL